MLIKLAFWLGVAVLLMPSDKEQQARLYMQASHTVERVATFCDRNAETCAKAKVYWAEFQKKAEFAGRMALDIIAERQAKQVTPGPATEASAQRPVVEPARTTQPQQPAVTTVKTRALDTRTIEPRRAEPKTDPRNTLRPADLQPAWRGGDVSTRGA
jgi:hypothetical protein